MSWYTKACAGLNRCCRSAIRKFWNPAPHRHTHTNRVTQGEEEEEEDKWW